MNFDFGKEGEKIASQFLVKKGYTILEKNYRALRGEIDIIAKYKNHLIFVEVKRRSLSRYGDSIEAVSVTKQKQISKIAIYYMQKNRMDRYRIQFDVIGINTTPTKDEIIHIENAFENRSIYEL